MARPAEEAHASQPRPRDFDAWMGAEQKRVYRLCYRLLGQRDEADTATQEVFLKAYRALSRPGAEEPDEPSRWLTRVTVNTCLDQLRSRRWRFWRQRPGPEDEQAILAMTPDSAPSAEDRLFAAEISKRLAKALQGLSGRQCSVFVLRHYEDMSLEEIAATLGLEVGTVKAHMARAVLKLREELRDMYLGPRRSAGRGKN
ncbi:MAG TPA: RNA polymerase sigma factor [Bryobacteraceae bacterium]|nr:RNA polymerase sigma factor [Bryobacteraceae bacterium]